MERTDDDKNYSRGDPKNLIQFENRQFFNIFAFLFFHQSSIYFGEVHHKGPAEFSPLRGLRSLGAAIADRRRRCLQTYRYRYYLFITLPATRDFFF